jgi:hypothetical protein
VWAPRSCDPTLVVGNGGSSRRNRTDPRGPTDRRRPSTGLSCSTYSTYSTRKLGVQKCGVWTSATDSGRSDDPPGGRRRTDGARLDLPACRVRPKAIVVRPGRGSASPGILTQGRDQRRAGPTGAALRIIIPRSSGVMSSRDSHRTRKVAMAQSTAPAARDQIRRPPRSVRAAGGSPLPGDPLAARRTAGARRQALTKRLAAGEIADAVAELGADPIIRP